MGIPWIMAFSKSTCQGSRLFAYTEACEPAPEASFGPGARAVGVNGNDGNDGNDNCIGKLVVASRCGFPATRLLVHALVSGAAISRLGMKMDDTSFKGL